jgi:5'-3' exonuclease
MNVHLVDGTYELFRHYYAVPPATDSNGRQVGAVRGVLFSILSMLEKDATHLGVATDHIIESFRNELYPGYKTSEGIPAALLSQFALLEEALDAMGVVVWPMVEFEADDALASMTAKAAADCAVTQVVICTPDKDLCQCVRGRRVVQLDRRRNIIRDEEGVTAKFGVAPESIPDYLAVVGDAVDGFPGVQGWGEKRAAAVLAWYPHLEDIPDDWRRWHASITNARRLSMLLRQSWSDALLFRTLATLRLDAPVFESAADLRWSGPRASFEALCGAIAAPDLFVRAVTAAEGKPVKRGASATS